MAFSTRFKNIANSMLKHMNMRIESLTDQRVEKARIRTLVESSRFERPVFAVKDQFNSFRTDELAKAFHLFEADLSKLQSGQSETRFDPCNAFFRTPDAEILYLFVRQLRPSRIIEVGSGNSTRVIRQALIDGGIDALHIAVDPEPRSEINGMTSVTIRRRFEETDLSVELASLEQNDILFIDSSHEVAVANDVVRLFCEVIPFLRSGVAVHVHDVFLPFDYPDPFHHLYSRWGEQYLLYLLLLMKSHEVLWPGYFVQKTMPEASAVLPFLSGGQAQSFWFKT